MSGASVTENRQQAAAEPVVRPGAMKPLLFDLTGIDLSACLRSRTDLERFNPHRGVMALLDSVVWESSDHGRVVGLKHVRDDEFWVPGHFPDRPMFPGVLMIEAAAQLAAYLYNVRTEKPRLAAFTRLDNTSFRSEVRPGDDLFILCQEIKWSTRRFISDVQGLVNGETIAFEARITGISL